MAQFVGRKEELKTLGSLLKKKSASLVVIKGRRRVGKSRLVEELSARHPFDHFYRFSGLPPTPETTEQSQREIFAGQMTSQFGTSLELSGSDLLDWSTLFSKLADKLKKGRVLLFFDEISWMGSKDSDFLGKLKDAWDVSLKKNDQLLFVLCGSVSTWIEKNILSSTGYVGRISLDLTLKNLPLTDCAEFWNNSGPKTSPYEKLKLLAVTGGIPLYLEHINPNISAEENIAALCFRPSGLLFREFDNIFSDLFSKRSALYKKIMESLAKGPLNQEEICKEIGHVFSSNIKEYLDDLSTSGFILPDRTWNIKTGRSVVPIRYRISDCYSRFYLKYIEPNKHKIENDQFSSSSISRLAGWSTLMGLQFETLVLNNRKLIWEKLKIAPEEIVYDNPFFQKETTRRSGCQIDYLIQTRFNTLYVIEIKFSLREITPSVIEEVQRKIERLSVPKHFSYRPVLIHVNGLTEELEETDFFSSTLNFGEFL
jgi:uncharacterized protein